MVGQSNQTARRLLGGLLLAALATPPLGASSPGEADAACASAAGTAEVRITRALADQAETSPLAVLPAADFLARPPARPPAIGSTVRTLPRGCRRQSLGEVDYFVCDGVYYRPAIHFDTTHFVVSLVVPRG